MADCLSPSIKIYQQNEGLEKFKSADLHSVKHPRSCSPNDDFLKDVEGPHAAKRVCIELDKKLVCPLTERGCQVEESCQTLQEHFLTPDHHKYIKMAIDDYIREMHQGSLDYSPAPTNKQDYSELLESVDCIADSVSSLHDDNVQLHANAVRIHSTILEHGKQLGLLKSSVEETNNVTQAIQMSTTIIETEIDALKQMMNDLLSHSASDGTFLWKISDVGRKITDAIAEKQTSVYSAPFYSSPTGYKMCMRLYFNGDGHARRTHLSLFYVLMRGEHDAVLEWPFTYKITFCLYDQSGNKRHIVDSFRPDVKSNSFQRPRSNMNIASGIPKFCPLSIIQQSNNPYVMDDCMFIRCIVDFSSTPKAMLPYICNLNPGLPAAVRKTMIDAEIERQKLDPPPNSPPKPAES